MQIEIRSEIWIKIEVFDSATISTKNPKACYHVRNRSQNVAVLFLVRSGQHNGSATSVLYILTCMPMQPVVVTYGRRHHDRQYPSPFLQVLDGYCLYMYHTPSTFFHAAVTYSIEVVAVVVDGHHEQTDSTARTDALGAASLSVIKVLGPSPDDVESTCVIDLSNTSRHASTYFLREEAAVCNTLWGGRFRAAQIHT